MRLAADAGLMVVALTDHDVTTGIREALDAAAEIDAEKRRHESVSFRCLPGIEISTAYLREQHILGYLIDFEAPSFHDFMARLMTLRRERAENIIEYLVRVGAPVGYDEVMPPESDGYIGRPLIAAALVRGGYAESIHEAFQKYLTGEEYRKIPRPKPSAEESIAQIRGAGGVAVLAHPYSLGLSGAGFAKQIKTLMGMGLEGLECHYGVYTQEQTEELALMAKDLGLIVTGGSDFHGMRVKPGVCVASGRDGLLDFDDTSVAEELESAIKSRRSKTRG
jgi:predicted metal-dependent phosphoesterase TrpH